MERVYRSSRAALREKRQRSRHSIGREREEKERQKRRSEDEEGGGIHGQARARGGCQNHHSTPSLQPHRLISFPEK